MHDDTRLEGTHWLSFTCAYLLGTVTKSQHHSSVRQFLTDRFMFWSSLNWNIVQMLIFALNRSCIYIYLYHHFWLQQVFKGDKWYFSDLTITFNIFFFSSSKTQWGLSVCMLHGYNLRWSLFIHTLFDDLDFASRSQVYWNKLQFKIYSCPLFFKHCYIVWLLHTWKR